MIINNQANRIWNMFLGSLGSHTVIHNLQVEVHSTSSCREESQRLYDSLNPAVLIPSTFNFCIFLHSHTEVGQISRLQIDNKTLA